MSDSASKSGELILAIDAGTQSVRAGLVDQGGRIHHLVKTSITPYFSAQPGWAEQEPEYYWRMLCETCRKVLAAGDLPRERIAAVAVTTQRLTMINVDRDGNPLRPAIVWLDQRKADSAKVLPAYAFPILSALRLRQFIEYATEYCRSNWIRQNQPEIWAKTHKFLFLSGYLTHKLTGEFRDSAGNIVGTIPFDVKRFDWAAPRDLKWRLFPIEKDKLPELVPPAGLLGRITRKASEETGIPEGLPLLAASNDKACDIIGAGCLTPDRACISFGTTATINTQNDRYVELRPMLPPYPSAIPGQYYSEVMVLRGLWMVSWFKEEFGLQERLMARERAIAPEELLEELLKTSQPGSMGLVCQPYWTPGPELASCAKGAVIGFGDVHNRAHLYRSIIEGIIFALKEGAELTERKNGVAMTEIRATGGGSKSDSIMQITADVFGLPVLRPHTNETSVLGAALDAAVGLRLFPDFKAAFAAMTRAERIFEPIKENEKIYGELYSRVYRRMYGRLLPLFRDIQSITGYPE
ncbi:MAG TPA: FGGY-family carbohydrate kinase [Candidatus Brocadiia bacterium]|nr:FGGY-family carbohydrate kinase [Candidatus Brocadiia bacterium]